MTWISPSLFYCGLLLTLQSQVHGQATRGNLRRVQATGAVHNVSMGNYTDQDLYAPVFNGSSWIRGGSDIDAVPWFGILDDSSHGFSCGMSLVHGDIALTAAHCLQDEGGIDLPSHVRVGGSSINSGTRVRVSTGRAHPTWDGNLIRHADVAVLKLSTFLSNQVVTINSNSNVP
jgi:hypothetical protein